MANRSKEEGKAVDRWSYRREGDRNSFVSLTKSKINSTFLCSRKGNSTNLVIIIMLPTVKKMQNFLALNIRNGIYIEDMRKHEIPEPRQTAKHISL